MSCSYAVKSAGVKSLKRMSELTEVSTSTLKAWFVRKPLMFQALLEYSVKREKHGACDPRYVFLRGEVLARFWVISESDKKLFVKPSDGRPNRYINKSEKTLVEGDSDLCDLWRIQEARFTYFSLLQSEPKEVQDKERGLMDIGFLMREEGGTFLHGTSTPHVIGKRNTPNKTL